jgi:PAS domain S-box-containing protein
MIKHRRLTLIVPTLTAVAVGAWFVFRPANLWFNEYLHSAIETVEYVSALLMAGFLLNRKGKEGPDISAPLGLGFLGMGIMNAAHTALPPGDAFVFIRTAASLAGGLGFALVRLPERYKPLLSRRWLVWAVIAGSLSVCAVVFLFPGMVPAMTRGARFTSLAVFLNLLAGLLFIAGALRVAAIMGASSDIEYPLLSLAGLFFGLSGLAFKYSMLWSGAWWYWHVLRLCGSLLVLVLLFHRHLQIVAQLRTSLREQREAELSLRRSYERTKTIIDSMNDAVSLLDVRDFSIIGVNSTFLKEYGYSDELEVVGKHCYEITHGRKNVCDEPNDVCPLAETVRSGRHEVAEHVHWSRTGERIFAEVSTLPIKDEQGNVVQVVHVSRDITGRKRAEEERERLLDDIARSNRDLEQFASVASHDLKEPLRMVSSYVQLIARKYRGHLDENGDRYIGFAVEGAMRMEKLIEGLLAYSRIGSAAARWEPVDANGIFGQAVANLEAAVLEAGAVISRDDLPAVQGDATQLVQLFQNLIGNAVKYRNPGTAPRIHMSAETDGTMHRFSVRDNGIGIDPRHYERIFQLFQRLHSHDQYAGAGLGLAVCKRIVERHHGRIWLESALGAGATFFFTVPAVTRQCISENPPHVQPDAA